MTRTILHVDMDAFFVSVELLRRPELRGRPVVVGGAGRRGVVAAASYEARAHGVHSAMPSLRARRLCPHAVFLSGDHAHYAAVSARVMEVFASLTPLVEPISLDEAFLDVTGARRLHGDGAAIAAEVRRRVWNQEGLICSVGIAASKFVAKLASEAAKPRASTEGARPGPGVVEVEPGSELSFLHPLPVRALWGVGPRTHERLTRLGITTVAELAALPLPVLQSSLGTASGAHLHALAHAVDDRPVTPSTTPKSIGHEETFASDHHDHDTLHVELVRLSDAVAARSRRAGLAARTVSIKVRFGDFRTITRSVTFAAALDSGPDVLRAAAGLLGGIDVSCGVRLLGVSLSNLGPPGPRQLSLEDAAAPDRSEALKAAVDDLRARFGQASVVPATLAGPGGPRVKARGDQQWGPDGRE